MKRAITEIHKKCWSPKEIYAYWYVGKLPFHQNLRVPSGHFHIDGRDLMRDEIRDQVHDQVRDKIRDKNIIFVNISKTTPYFFLIMFGPLRRIMKTSFEKKCKKNGIFFQKISKLFVFR